MAFVRCSKAATNKRTASETINSINNNHCSSTRMTHEHNSPSNKQFHYFNVQNLASRDI